MLTSKAQLPHGNSFPVTLPAEQAVADCKWLDQYVIKRLMASLTRLLQNYSVSARLLLRSLQPKFI